MFKQRKFYAAAVVALVAMAFSASLAQAATPKPGYTQFAGCPSKAEVPTVAACIHSVITGGHFQMGNKNVPITNAIEMTGGVNGSLEE